MKMENLKDLYKEELKDMLNGEQQILKALPKLIKAARSDELREALENHLNETKEQKSRLEQCLADVGLPAKGKTCEGLKGILLEGDGAVSDAEDDVTDATIIASAQKVEHYEIASYGCLRTYASMLGLESSVQLLQTTLDEEKAADEKLTEIAEAFANDYAAQGESTDEDEEEGFEPGEDEAEEGSERRSRETAGVGAKSATKGSNGSKGSRTGSTTTARRRDRAKA